MKHVTRLHKITCLLILVVGLIGFGAADVTAEEIEGWQFTLSPFFWATGLNGSTSIGPVDQEVDVSFGDILDSLTLAAMVDLRLDYNRWGIQSNVIWVDMSSEETSEGINVKVEPTMWIVDADIHYQVAPAWELLAGIRYFDIDIDLGLKPAGAQQTMWQNGNKSWIDPIVGAGFSAPLSESWWFKARGDIGGFGAGSEFAWQLRGGFDWRFGSAKRHSLFLGWRHLAWDYKDDDGKATFEMETYMTGPIAGASFRF
jgi:hypothetical protein